VYGIKEPKKKHAAKTNFAALTTRAHGATSSKEDDALGTSGTRKDQRLRDRKGTSKEGGGLGGNLGKFSR